MTKHYPEQPQFPVSGRLIKRLTINLAERNEWSREESMYYIGDKTKRSRDMVYRWQQGRTRPKPELVEVLAQIAYKETNLPREWGEEFLEATNYRDPVRLLNQ